MINISMELIKTLRDKTGAGISDCKTALTEAVGDMEKAIEILRKKGIAKAAKRGDREVSEGVILVGVNAKNNEGYILEINSETDFVARNDKFKEFSANVFDIIKEKKPTDLGSLFSLPMDNVTVKETLDTLSGVIGEKLGIKGLDILTGGTVAAYSHMGGRIGALVSLDKEEQGELAREIAMQVAAANPKYIYPEDVPAEELAKEKDIYREQLKKEGKPENMIEKILEGKLNKYFEEVCLVKQEYIKDDKKKVENILGGVKVEKFVRYSL
jgi:elongation factor Ts